MLYYEVTILEEPKHTKEQFEKLANKLLKELQEKVGTKYPLIDEQGNQVEEFKYTQEEFDFVKRKVENARIAHKPRLIVKLFSSNSIEELENKINEYIEFEKEFMPIALPYMGRLPRVYKVVEKREVTWGELVDVEIKYLKEQLFRRYFFSKLLTKKMTYKKEQELKNKYLNNEKYMFEMLRYINKMFEAEKIMGRDGFNLSKTKLKEMSAKEFVERAKFLADCEEADDEMLKKLKIHSEDDSEFSKKFKKFNLRII